MLCLCQVISSDIVQLDLSLTSVSYRMTNLLVQKIIFAIFYFSALSTAENYDTSYMYDADESPNDYEFDGNETDEYFTFSGRNDNIFEEIRPANTLNHYLSNHNQLQDLNALLNLHRPNRLKPALKRKTHMKYKHFKHLLPLLLAALAKVAHFLPVVKLTLLALFALVLFSKKALLVSLGSLILVIYDIFYKGKYSHSNIGVSIVKDRGSTTPTVEHGLHPDEPGLHSAIESSEEHWLGREEVSAPKLNPREDSDTTKKKRWWAPQINHKGKSNVIPIRRSGSRMNENYMIFKDLDEMISNLKEE